MERCLIVFDLDTKRLKETYHNESWTNAYADVGRILKRHKFENIQGTVYLSEVGVRQAHGTIALQEVSVRYPWFGESVRNVQFYDLADDFDAQFIVDGVARARQAFERRIEELRQQLVLAGLDVATVNAVIAKQQFSLENSSPISVLPPANK